MLVFGTSLQMSLITPWAYFSVAVFLDSFKDSYLQDDGTNLNQVIITTSLNTMKTPYIKHTHTIKIKAMMMASIADNRILPLPRITRKTNKTTMKTL